MQIVRGPRGIALLCVAIRIRPGVSGMRTGVSAVGWYAWQYPGRMPWGDGLAVVILIALWVMATDLQKNVSELRMRLPALEHSGERARELGKDREAEQARWKP